MMRPNSLARPASGTRPEPEQSKPETADEKAVKECFYRYKKAALNGKGTEVRECVDSNTIKYYDKLIKQIKTASKKEVEGLSLLNRMTVLLVRHKFPKEQIMPMTGESFIIRAVEEDMIGKVGTSEVEIGTVTVNGDFASSKMKSLKDKRGEAPFGFQFNRENGKWKIDLSSIMAVSEMAVKKW